MSAQSMELAWIVVKDLKQAVKFYTETVGLKLLELNEAFNWAELEGQAGGAKLGIAQAGGDGDCADLEAGQNAFVTFTVPNLDKAMENAAAKGAKFLGNIEEVPGHVRMLMVVDADGNRFQLVEKLSG